MAVDNYTDANSNLYNTLYGALNKEVNAAVADTGKLYGNGPMSDTRVNTAADGDGLSMVESWILATERFGENAKEDAKDMVTQGAGWLLQTRHFVPYS